MQNLYARSVFFVHDAERAARFYTAELGFTLDWTYDEDGQPFVFQVSLFGFELIVNQTREATRGREGRGRVFIGLEPAQIEPLHAHVAANGIRTERVDWGRSTLVIRDIDGNELYFWDQPTGQPSESDEATSPA